MLRNLRLLASAAARRCISTSRQLASEPPMRIERDSMGEVSVPASAYYGASTQRAIDNFRISGLRLPRAFIRALGQVKQCAAVANQSLGVLDSRLAVPIAAAAGRRKAPGCSPPSGCGSRWQRWPSGAQRCPRCRRPE